jgi:hypothetical protein
MNFKRIILFLSLLFLISFVFSFNGNVEAQTTTEIQSLIQKLQAQIKELQEQLTQKIGEESTVWCYNFNNNLRIGDKGQDVSALRGALTKEGFSGLEAMGGAYEFDEKLASAVVGFQQKYVSEILVPWGLTRGTGFVGASTRVKLNALYGCNIAPTPTPTPTSPSITILSPNGGEQLMSGNTYDIKWNFPEAEGKIYITLEKWSVGDAVSTRSIVPETLATTETYSWTIPKDQEVGSRYKINIGLLGGASKGSSGVGDSSDNYFSIVSTVTSPDISAPSIKSISPEFGTTNEVIVIHGGNLFSTKPSGIYVEFLKNGIQKGTITSPINTQADGSSLSFTLSERLVENISPGEYQIRVSNDYGNSNRLNFTVNPRISLISPNGGEEWLYGSSHDIKWDSAGIDNVDIYLDKWTNNTKNPATLVVARNVPASSGYYSWNMGYADSGDYYKIRIAKAGNIYSSQITDSSDEYFSVLPIATTTEKLDSVFINNLTNISNPISYEVLDAPSLGDLRPGLTYSWQYKIKNNTTQDLGLDYKAVYASIGQIISQDVLGGGAIVIVEDDKSEYYSLGETVKLSEGKEQTLIFSLTMGTPLEVDLALKITITS